MLRTCLIALVLCGCATVPKKPPFVPPTVVFQELHIDKLDFEGADAVVLYAVKNANAGTLKVEGVFYLFQANGRPVEAGQPADGADVPPGDSQLAFPVKLIWPRLVPVYPALGPEERMQWLATGNLRIETPQGPLRFDLSHEDTLPMPVLPHITVDPPKLVSLNAMGAQMAIPLRLANQTDYPVTLTGVEAQVRFQAGYIGKLVLPSQGTIAPHEEKAVTATVDFVFASQGFEAARTLRDGGAGEMYIDGSMAIGDWGMPFTLAQFVSVQRP
ncbi:MAG TPA: hypothetical protein VH083_13530 [Myxococcales bacterium]|nr:hypothetical protein [Myxococcales bacterium]